MTRFQRRLQANESRIVQHFPLDSSPGKPQVELNF